MRISLIALAALGDVRGVTEIRMFGGLCFTVHGNMAVGVTGDDLMVRLAPADGEAALAEPGARPMDFTGKPLKGFVFVGAEGLNTERMLKSWVNRGSCSRRPCRRRSPSGRRLARRHSTRRRRTDV